MKWPLVTRKRFEALQIENAELVKRNSELLIRDAQYAAVERRTREVAFQVKKIQKKARGK